VTSRHPKQIGGWTAAIVVICVASLIPVLWIVFLSLKTSGTATDGSFIPHQWTLSNYSDIFKQGIFTDALRNSIGIGLISTVLGGWCQTPLRRPVRIGLKNRASKSPSEPLRETPACDLVS
jgi:ABC-type glycerol-3-phosphate transport system permease component